MKSRSAPLNALSKAGLSKAGLSKAGLSKAALSKAAMSKAALPTVSNLTPSTWNLLSQIDDDDDEDEVDVKRTMDLDEFIEYGCSKFVCPYKIYVKKDVLKDDHPKLKPGSSTKQKKVTPHHTKPVTSDSDKIEESSKESRTIDSNSLVITALYDHSNRLVELLLQDLPDVPRVLMQILGLIMPKFPALTTVAMKKCRINKYTIYELEKVLEFTSITDICLDGSSFLEANYAMLLNKSRLQSLSLARCNINDVVCETIASELQFLQPAETHLVTLNLSSNCITDEGAKHLGLALRTNRHLRYLNLCNNKITDEGADHIFQVLMIFPLSDAEIEAKRRRYATYLRAKYDIIRKHLIELESPSAVSNMGKKMKAREGRPFKLQTIKHMKTYKIDDLAFMRAENKACEQIGPLIDPFHNNYLKVINDSCYCAGNMVLCYLNLGYNNISLIGMKKLLEVVKYQSMTKKLSQLGLLQVVIEGNNLPNSCLETDLLHDYLKRNVVYFTPKFKSTIDPKGGRARTRSRVISGDPLVQQ